MNHLNKRRDELAHLYASNCYEVESSVGYMNANEDFQEGFDAAITELKPEIDRLVEALEKIKLKETMCIYGTMDLSDTPEKAFRQGSNYAWVETGNIATEALQKWREFKGE